MGLLRYELGTVDKPITKTSKCAPKISSGKIVATCFAFDFFIAEADEWRMEAWADD